jgi:3-isopropylmalate/(R)-2-methylmalate dehydratase small subunit
VNTDEIIPAKYLNMTDPKELGRYCMEGVERDFVKQVAAGDIIVAGKNFGCGSSREHAPWAIKGSGITCVVAESFARIFYRNAINIGLPIVESETAARQANPGDILEIDLSAGKIENVTQNKAYVIPPFAEFMQEIINAGGLINWVKIKEV